MMEQLTYRARDWGTIATDMPPADPFAHHLRQKAEASTRRFGQDKPWSETVDTDTARDIRQIAHRKRIEPAAAPSAGVEERCKKAQALQIRAI